MSNQSFRTGFSGPWCKGTCIFEQQPTHGLLPSENKETTCVKPCDSLLGKVLTFLRAHDCSRWFILARNKYRLHKVNWAAWLPLSLLSKTEYVVYRNEWFLQLFCGWINCLITKSYVRSSESLGQTTVIECVPLHREERRLGHEFVYLCSWINGKQPPNIHPMSLDDLRGMWKAQFLDEKWKQVPVDCDAHLLNLFT